MLMKNPEITRASHRWNQEDSDIAEEIDRIVDWIAQNKRGSRLQRMQLATLLSRLHRMLHWHFVSENELNQRLSQNYPPQCEDVVFVCRQACSDQLYLLDVLENLIVNIAVSPVNTNAIAWTDALEEVSEFFAAFRDHEISEAASIALLCQL